LEQHANNRKRNHRISKEEDMIFRTRRLKNKYRIPIQETKLTSNDTSEYREQLEAKNIFEELQETSLSSWTS
jgi:hypothetical protein